MLKKLIKQTKKHFREVIKIKKSPHSIALGFAVGTFISILPTPGFNIFIGILITLIFPQINKISLFGSMLLWNPATAAFIYPTSYKIGQFIFKDLPIIEYNITFFHKAFIFTRKFLVGNLILATTVSSLSYALVRMIAQNYQDIRKRSRIKLRKNPRNK